jgi:amino acid transporter
MGIDTGGWTGFLYMDATDSHRNSSLVILVFSYRHVVDTYPNGGGAYIVAKENLGPIYGLIAGASLSVDYALTVAVSVCAGTAALTSALPLLYPHRIGITILFILILVVGNVRGIRESSRIFSIPTYAFILCVVTLLIAGILKHLTGNNPSVPVPSMSAAGFGTETMTVFFLLKAFSSGCSALTGVEAVSNAVPNFKDPAPRNAKATYLLLTIAIIICFGVLPIWQKFITLFPIRN